MQIEESQPRKVDTNANLKGKKGTTGYSSFLLVPSLHLKHHDCNHTGIGFAAYGEQHPPAAASLEMGSLKFAWLFLQHISSKKSPRLGESRAKTSGVPFGNTSNWDTETACIDM